MIDRLIDPLIQNVNKRLDQTHVQERLKKLEEGRGIDWSTAETLAIGTLLLQGGCGIPLRWAWAWHPLKVGVAFP